MQHCALVDLGWCIGDGFKGQVMSAYYFFIPQLLIEELGGAHNLRLSDVVLHWDGVAHMKECQ